MQGLGAGPISLFGSDVLKQRYLPGVAVGTSIAAFALSESDAGSDVTAVTVNMQINQLKKGISRNHEGDGMNVLYGDGHVVWVQTPFCAAPSSERHSSPGAQVCALANGLQGWPMDGLRLQPSIPRLAAS